MNRSTWAIALAAAVAALGPARADDDYRDRPEQQRRSLRKLEERRRDAERDYAEDIRDAQRDYAEDARDARRRSYNRGYRGYTPAYGPAGHADYPQPYDPPPAYGEPYPVPYGPGEPTGYPEAYSPPPVEAPRYAEPAPPPGAGPAADADALIEQSAAFLQVFSQTGAKVPQAGRQLAEAQALNDAARYFRQLLAADSAPAQLAEALAAIESSWDRMSRRTERLARGRTGPNIEQVRLMGRTIDRLRQAFPY